MNKDKVGLGAISLPQILFSFYLLGYAKAYFHLPYRQTDEEGIEQGHVHRKIPSILNYTTISRRINRLDINIENDNSSKEFKDDYIIVAIDSTGIKVTNRACG